jgi:O-antigen/teichoic acid export membrane protein
MSFFRGGSDSERRRAQWDLEAGFGNYAALVFGQGLGAALGFVSIWLAARALGSDGYGGIVALVAASQLVGQASVQWTAISLFRHGCREFVDEGRIAAAFWNRLAILAANLLLVALAAPFWLPRVSSLLSIPDDARGLVLLHLASTALSIHSQQSLQAAKLPRFQSVLQIAERAAIVAAIAVSAVLGGTTWRTVALAFALAPLLSTAIALVRLRRLIWPPVALNGALLGRMLRFSFPLLFFSVVGYLTTNHLDAIFILRFLSSSDLGVYAVAYQIAGTFMQLSSLLGSLFMAFFITADGEGDGARIERFFVAILPALTLAWTSFAAVVAILGGLLLDSFFDRAFQPARMLLWPLLAAAALAAPVTMAFGPAVNARSRTSIAAVAAVVAAAANTLANTVLIPRFGLVGCAWATTAAFGASLAVFVLLAPRAVSAPRSWTFYATLPMALGAACEPLAGEWGALAITLVASSAVALARRRELAVAFENLSSLPAVEALTLRWGGRVREESP